MTEKHTRLEAEMLKALEMQHDVDMLRGAIVTHWDDRITAIVDKYPALLNLNMSEATALIILSGAAVELRMAAIAKARGEAVSA